LFKKDLVLLGKNTKSNKAKPQANPAIQFFQRGVTWVMGVKNRVAFKAI
jgi:hypothetical protein